MLYIIGVDARDTKQGKGGTMVSLDDELKTAFAEHGVEMVCEGTYRVPSSNGRSQYTVRFEGCPEFMNENVQTWSCTCPAGKFGRTCKHINEVINASDAVDGGY